MVSARALRGALAVVFALFFVGLAAHSASAQDDLPSVEAARVSTTPERARLIIDLSAVTEFAVASIAEPNRIAVDVRAGSVPTIATQPVAGEGIVASFTTTIAADDRVRVELMLTTPSVVQQAYLLDAVGDLALCGLPIYGRFRSYKGGHALNALVLQGLFASSANYEIVYAEDLPLGYDALNDMPDGVEVRPYLRSVG